MLLFFMLFFVFVSLLVYSMRSVNVFTVRDICLCLGIQTSTCYWPVKILDMNKVMLFKLQFWDAGESACKKFDHVLSVRSSSILKYLPFPV